MRSELFLVQSFDQGLWILPELLLFQGQCLELELIQVRPILQIFRGMHRLALRVPSRVIHGGKVDLVLNAAPCPCVWCLGVIELQLPVKVEIDMVNAAGRVAHLCCEGDID